MADVTWYDANINFVINNEIMTLILIAEKPLCAALLIARQICIIFRNEFDAFYDWNLQRKRVLQIRQSQMEIDIAFPFFGGG